MATPRQRLQQRLAWLSFQTKGAIANFYAGRNSTDGLPSDVVVQLRLIKEELVELDNRIKNYFDRSKEETKLLKQKKQSK